MKRTLIATLALTLPLMSTVAAEDTPAVTIVSDEQFCALLEAESPTCEEALETFARARAAIPSVSPRWGPSRQVVDRPLHERMEAARRHPALPGPVPGRTHGP
jgi:hypothetical protein